jgi:hypothetical protein
VINPFPLEDVLANKSSLNSAGIGAQTMLHCRLAHSLSDCPSFEEFCIVKKENVHYNIQHQETYNTNLVIKIWQSDERM